MLELRAAAGARIRGSKQEYAGTEFGHDLPWAAGIIVRPQAFGIDPSGRLRFGLESHGAVAMTPSFGARRASPAFVGLSARYGLGAFAFNLGGEIAVSDAIGAPLARVTAGIGFAPRFPDVDEDGVVDDKDECAELAEDRDGFQDGDGCPDFDDDDDGVPDDTDKCPRQKEDVDEYQDDDGCPDPDNDHDGVPDAGDKCPNEPGPASGAGGEPGCPFKDRDVDGIPDPIDKCPTKPEDRGAFEDSDGCPSTTTTATASPKRSMPAQPRPGPSAPIPT